MRATAKRSTGRRRMNKLQSLEEMGANIITDAQGPVGCFRGESTRHCIHGVAKSSEETCHRCEFLHVTMKPQSNKNVLSVVMTLHPHQAPHILALWLLDNTNGRGNVLTLELIVHEGDHCF